jgi:hypothetical protein
MDTFLHFRCRFVFNPGGWQVMTVGSRRAACRWLCVLFALVAHGVLPAPSHAQTIHTAHDHIPDFAATPTIRSSASGAWSAASTWSPARVPGPSDVVNISHAVVYDVQNGDVDAIGIRSGGALRFVTDRNTRLRVSTLMVLAGGTLEIGTESAPVQASVNAEIVIKDKALNLQIDPDQFGTGLLSVDGTVRMHGAPRQPTFVRTSIEPRAGHATVTLEQGVSGWQVGDRIFLPDTRQVPTDHRFNPDWALHFEERTIQGVSADGRTITLSAPLDHDHRGARDADGTPTVLPNGIRLLPHVGNLSRNVVIRSENPAGTRGHTLYTRRSDVKIAYVQFQDLGRTRAIPLDATTNHIGRYPVHIHHVWGPVNPANTGYQFSLIGNAVNESLKWPIAVHGSHYGLIRHNVVYGGPELTGSGIAVEDGSETENLFEANFVANIRGYTEPRDSGPSTADGTTPGSAAECIWGAGFNNRFVDNVVSGCRNPVSRSYPGPGFKLIVPPAPYTTRAPKFRGADMTDTNQTVAVTPQMQPHSGVPRQRGIRPGRVRVHGVEPWHRRLHRRSHGGDRDSRLSRLAHVRSGALELSCESPDDRGLVYRIDPSRGSFGGLPQWEAVTTEMST